MFNVRNHAIHGVIDYVQLMSVLKDYKAPHRKINIMLKSGELIRIKKGLYVLGDNYRDEPICLEFLANLIYGPSYISQEYALQYYGMIPERVDIVTSMTCKRLKLFKTPVGTFQYAYLNLERFNVGIDWQTFRSDMRLLIASPEKAIVDTLIQYPTITTMKDMSKHLIENLRIDESALKNLDLNRLEKISDHYHNAQVKLFYKTIRRGE